MFFGNFKRGIDNRGRVYIPPAFLEKIGERKVVISRIPEGCVSFRLIEKGEGTKIDRGGKIRIPRKLRDYAGLRDEVIIAGCKTTIEIWAKEKWENEMREIINDSNKMFVL